MKNKKLPKELQTLENYVIEVYGSDCLKDKNKYYEEYSEVVREFLGEF